MRDAILDVGRRQLSHPSYCSRDAIFPDQLVGALDAAFGPGSSLLGDGVRVPFRADKAVDSVAYYWRGANIAH